MCLPNLTTVFTFLATAASISQLQCFDTSTNLSSLNFSSPNLPNPYLAPLEMTNPINSMNALTNMAVPAVSPVSLPSITKQAASQKVSKTKENKSKADFRSHPCLDSSKKNSNDKSKNDRVVNVPANQKPRRQRTHFTSHQVRTKSIVYDCNYVIVTYGNDYCSWANWKNTLNGTVTRTWPHVRR